MPAGLGNVHEVVPTLAFMSREFTHRVGSHRHIGGSGGRAADSDRKIHGEMSFWFRRDEWRNGNETGDARPMIRVEPIIVHTLPAGPGRVGLRSGTTGDQAYGL